MISIAIILLIICAAPVLSANKEQKELFLKIHYASILLMVAFLYYANMLKI